MSKASEAGGYGWSHRRERERLLGELRRAGELPCSICRRPMTLDMELDLHHLEPTVLGGARGPRKLAHARCNRGQGRALALGRRPRPPQQPLRSNYSRQW
ncbi:hypothetical protein ACFQ1L_11860 [Phytohabitans flavus]|uniref:hypothetical protein n=1 Tax=Phytohabitans flavus TaxID=1076124 RepID=UPI001564CD6C|nr:hypothetical protein [Phytohabitans flavus]